MTPEVFTDPRLPGMEILWWPEHHLYEIWLQVGQRNVYRSCFHDSTAVTTSQAHKVAKKRLQAAHERIWNSLLDDVTALLREGD